MNKNKEHSLPASQFYDAMAAYYKLIDDDWNGWLETSRYMLTQVFDEYAPRATSILDCAAGIGTQALLLAEMGYEVTATDVSESALEVLSKEANSKGLAIPNFPCSWNELPRALNQQKYDTVICFENSLAHLLTNADLHFAVKNMAECLRAGGHLFFSMRHYDELKPLKPTGSPQNWSPEMNYYQTWEWIDDEVYKATWHVNGINQGPVLMRAITENELLSVFQSLGMDVTVRDDIYYMKIFIVRKPIY